MSSFIISILTISSLFSTNSVVVVGAEVRSNSRCKDVSLECEYRHNYCSVPHYAGLMFKICRFTCDWCQKSLNDVIHRKSFASVPDVLPADIPEWLTAPTNPGESESHGSTRVTAACADYSNSCSTTAALCDTPNYQTIMAKKCPKTCHVCE